MTDAIFVGVIVKGEERVFDGKKGRKEKCTHASLVLISVSNKLVYNIANVFGVFRWLCPV